LVCVIVFPGLRPSRLLGTSPWATARTPLTGLTSRLALVLVLVVVLVLDLLFRFCRLPTGFRFWVPGSGFLPSASPLFPLPTDDCRATARTPLTGLASRLALVLVVVVVLVLDLLFGFLAPSARSCAALAALVAAAPIRRVRGRRR